MLGNSITTNLYEKALDGSWARQQAIANNIANGETPNYKVRKVDFESALEVAVAGLGGDRNEGLRSIQNAGVKLTADPGLANQLDGNSVDLDSENVDMTKAVAQYYYLVNGINSSFSRIKYALSEGR